MRDGDDTRKRSSVGGSSEEEMAHTAAVDAEVEIGEEATARGRHDGARDLDEGTRGVTARRGCC